MATLRSKSNGFTIIEAMIGIALLAVLLGLAMPSFSTMIQNARLRGEAETIVAALKLARSEALKRNGNVEFLFTDGAIDANNAAASATGTNWQIRVPGANAVIIDARAGAESGRSNAARTSAGIADWNGSVLFNALGETNLAAPLTFELKSPNNCYSAEKAGGVRCLNVVLTQSGSTRVCDPAVPVTGTDARRCPAPAGSIRTGSSSNSG